MYSESDLEGAVAAGIMSPTAADAFRQHIATTRATPAVDEESFRLLTGFNDIFVGIAIALLLAALAQLGDWFNHALAGAAVAAAAWGLAEYFTRVRRMALPSIILLIAFVGGVAATMVGALVEINPDWSDRTNALVGSGIALVTGGAAWLHWRRFMVPITVAVGAAALVGVLIGLFFAATHASENAIFPLVLVGGLATFALAMWWDGSDRERKTRRSDVAFWLHLAAAPMIAHPVFHMLGVFQGDIGAAQAVIVMALYVVFAIIALAIDRRALLVSSLAYVLYALSTLFHQAGAVELSMAFTALVIGSALLSLSAFWQPMRRAVVGMLGGGLANRLPPAQAAIA
jgi:type III secretory pathway component EscS